MSAFGGKADNGAKVYFSRGKCGHRVQPFLWAAGFPVLRK
jgi:hypothetical protein